MVAPETGTGQRIPVTPTPRPIEVHRGDVLGKRRTVLLVDDEREILDTLRRGLAILLPAVELVTFTDPSAALDELRRRSVDVVVSDHHMTPMDGASFLALARSVQPRAARILLTGTILPNVPVRGINEAHVSAYLTKPASLPDLARAIEDAFGAA